ncbi:MAG: hypothetical protein CVU63_00590 [Deltaproteobacteria bacterium HGW-Deltaproteobacteria-20]|nr:MAG: hypothetical protein CVU63_00590 [Deltaproteobacteria bacterium HGW-Deltaproteobacteria-20]
MATTGRGLTIALATAGLIACGGKTEGTGPGDGGAAGESGGSGGTAGSGGSGGTAGSGGAAGIGGTGGMQGDPACFPIYCPSVEDGSFMYPEATLDGSTLRVVIQTYYSDGSFDGSVEITVDPALGTLLSTETTGYDVTIEIELAPGTTGGDLVFDGVLRDECYSGSGELCDVRRSFHVELSDGGAPKISRRQAPQSPLQLRPRVALTLVETGDLWARVQASGAPRDATISFDVTDGSISTQGADALWTLPERPGLYQVEVVVQYGGSIATEAVVLEVREGDARKV